MRVCLFLCMCFVLWCVYVCVCVYCVYGWVCMCVCEGVVVVGGHWAVSSQLLLKSCSIRPCRFQLPRGLATGLWDVAGWLFGQTPLPG